MPETWLCQRVEELAEQVQRLEFMLDRTNIRVGSTGNLHGSTYEISEYQIAQWVAGTQLPLGPTSSYARFINGGLEIRGGKFDLSTAASPTARMEMTGDYLRTYNASNVKTFDLNFATGDVYVVGEFYQPSAYRFNSHGLFLETASDVAKLSFVDDVDDMTAYVEYGTLFHYIFGGDTSVISIGSYGKGATYTHAYTIVEAKEEDETPWLALVMDTGVDQIKFLHNLESILVLDGATEEIRAVGTSYAACFVNQTKAGTPTAANTDGAIVIDTASNRLYFRSGGAWHFVAPGTAAGTMTTVKSGGVQVGGADIVTLDFNANEFILTEAPDTEINITIKASGISHAMLSGTHNLTTDLNPSHVINAEGQGISVNVDGAITAVLGQNDLLEDQLLYLLDNAGTEIAVLQKGQSEFYNNFAIHFRDHIGSSLFAIANDVPNTLFSVTSNGEIALTGTVIVNGNTVFNEDGNDIDFRIEGLNHTYMFWVNADRDNINLASDDAASPGRLNIYGSSGEVAAAFGRWMETTAGSTYIDSNAINFGYGYDDDAGAGWINYTGYHNGVTRFRDFSIGDGKKAAVTTWDGSSKLMTHYGALDIAGTFTIGEVAAPAVGTANHGVIYFNQVDEHLYCIAPSNIIYKLTHNLTTDIDHNQLTNYVANRHIDWTNAANDFSTSGTGTITGGAFTLAGPDNSNKYFRMQDYSNDGYTTMYASGSAFHFDLPPKGHSQMRIYSKQDAATDEVLHLESDYSASWYNFGNWLADGTLQYKGNLQAYRNAGYTKGYIYVPLTTPATSTSFDGDLYDVDNDGATIDLSSSFNLPAGIKAVDVDISMKCATVGKQFMIGPSSTYYYAVHQYSQVANQYNNAHGICPCDANGDIYFQVDAVHGAEITVYMRIWGYWI